MYQITVRSESRWTPNTYEWTKDAKSTTKSGAVRKANRILKGCLSEEEIETVQKWEVGTGFEIWTIPSA